MNRGTKHSEQTIKLHLITFNGIILNGNRELGGWQECKEILRLLSQKLLVTEKIKSVVAGVQGIERY